MTFPVKFKPTNLQQKKPSNARHVCIVITPPNKHPFGCVLLVDSPERVYNTRIPPRPLYKKTPFRVCSFGGLPRTCLQHENPSPSTLQKNTLSGVFFWWTPQNAFANTRILPRPLYKKNTLSGVFFLVDGDGFEPSKAVPADLQSDPFGRSGTRPGAGDWSRTNNLLITNQLLCH